MKYALISEEQIKDVMNGIVPIFKNDKQIAIDVLKSLKIQNPIGCIGYDKRGTPYFTDPEDGKPIYILEQE